MAHVGEVPHDARRLADFEAHEHRATWVRRVLGKGICSYVTGYILADRWWTYCFERVAPSTLPDRQVPPSDEVELWSIEAYDSSGSSWTETYRYDLLENQWERNEEARSVPVAQVRTPREI